MMPMRVVPAAPRSRVQHSTTEPLRSPRHTSSCKYMCMRVIKKSCMKFKRSKGDACVNQFNLIWTNMTNEEIVFHTSGTSNLTISK